MYVLWTPNVNIKECSHILQCSYNLDYIFEYFTNFCTDHKIHGKLIYNIDNTVNFIDFSHTSSYNGFYVNKLNIISERVFTLSCHEHSKYYEHTYIYFFSDPDDMLDMAEGYFADESKDSDTYKMSDLINGLMYDCVYNIPDPKIHTCIMYVHYIDVV
jgi:hypothetical protein